MRGRLIGVAVGVVLLALLARAWHCSVRGGLWRDEANGFFVVRESASLEELFRNLRVESTPPLQPLLEYGLQRLAGPDPFWLRAVMALFGTLTVAGIVILGWRAFHPACGLLAGLLAATSPYLIRLSGEMRNYAIFGALAALHAGLYLRHLERRRLADACLWGGAAAALAYAHYYAFPIVFCAGLWAAACASTRADVVRLGAAAATFLVLYAPWMPSFLHQLGSDLQPWYPPGTDTVGLYQVIKLPLGRAGPYLLGASLVGGAWMFRPHAPSALFAQRPERTRFWSLLAISIAPAALAWILQVYAGAFESRYLLGMVVPLLPAACFFWSRLFVGEPLRVPVPWRKTTFLVDGPMQRRVACLLFAAAIVGQYLDRARWLRRSSPADEFAALVEQHGRPDDLLWIFPAPYASSFNFHFDGPQAQLAFPFRGRVTKVDWPALRDREQDPEVIDEFLGELDRHLARGGRVWGLFVESLPLDASWPFWEGPSPRDASRLARAELQVHRRALRVLYTRGRVAGWWDRPHHDYHEGMTLILFDPPDPPAEPQAGKGPG